MEAVIKSKRARVAAGGTMRSTIKQACRGREKGRAHKRDGGGQVDERVLRGLIVLASWGLMAAGIQLFEAAVIVVARALGRC